MMNSAGNAAAIPERFVYQAEEALIDDGVDSSEHPARGYFDRLLESAREEIMLQGEDFLLDEDEDEEFRNGLLPFKDSTGRLYMFNFFTNEISGYLTEETDHERHEEKHPAEEEKMEKEGGLNEEAVHSVRDGGKNEEAYYTMSDGDLECLVKRGGDVVWEVLRKHVSEADFLAYVKAIGVVPRKEHTEVRSFSDVSYITSFE